MTEASNTRWAELLLELPPGERLAAYDAMTALDRLRQVMNGDARDATIESGEQHGEMLDAVRHWVNKSTLQRNDIERYRQVLNGERLPESDTEAIAADAHTFTDIYGNRRYGRPPEEDGGLVFKGPSGYGFTLMPDGALHRAPTL